MKLKQIFHENNRDYLLKSDFRGCICIYLGPDSDIIYNIIIIKCQDYNRAESIERQDNTILRKMTLWLFSSRKLTNQVECYGLLYYRCLFCQQVHSECFPRGPVYLDRGDHLEDWKTCWHYADQQCTVGYQQVCIRLFYFAFNMANWVIYAFKFKDGNKIMS